MSSFSHSVNTVRKTTKSVLQALLLTAILFPVLALAQDESLPTFDGMDVFDLEWVSDPQVSPDGNSVVYVRRSNDIMSDRTRSQLWRIDADGQNHRPLLSELRARRHRGGRRMAHGSHLYHLPQVRRRFTCGG